jgi:hypothetical protein
MRAIGYFSMFLMKPSEKMLKKSEKMRRNNRNANI